MLLVVDVGNSNVVAALFEDDALAHAWRTDVKVALKADDLKICLEEALAERNLSFQNISRLAMSSTVPTLKDSLLELAQKQNLPTLWVDATVSSPVDFSLYAKNQLGADRVANAVAAFVKYRDNVIVVDAGSATTFDVVTKDAKYLGGMICPGLQSWKDSLKIKTPHLPNFEFSKPQNVIGRSSQEGLQSGFYFGYTGMIDALVERITAESKTNFKVIATGGLAASLKMESKTIQTLDPNLTLLGIKILSDFNLQKS